MCNRTHFCRNQLFQKLEVAIHVARRPGSIFSDQFALLGELLVAGLETQIA